MRVCGFRRALGLYDALLMRPFSCSRPEMIRLLSKMSSIKIRGGIYVGSEDAYIMDVKLVAGPHSQGAHRTSLKTQSIHTDL